MTKMIKLRSDKNVKGEQLYQCPFPNCRQIFAKEPGQPETCLKHRAFISDLVFALNHLEKGPAVETPAQEGPKIFIPKPGMSNKAIEEAARAAGRGP